MTQRHKIETWVSPGAWDDSAEAERVIDAIAASGSGDEAEWVSIAGGGQADVASAAGRAFDAAEEAVWSDLAAYRAAETAMEQAREDLHEALRRAMVDGHTAYRLAQVTGLSERHVGRIRKDK